jgi:hypothetical protein
MISWFSDVQQRSDEQSVRLPSSRRSSVECLQDVETDECALLGKREVRDVRVILNPPDRLCYERELMLLR